MNKFTVTITATKEPFLVARLAVMLRKYALDIQSLNISQPSDGTDNKDLVRITLVLLSNKTDISIAMKKVERLVPIASLTWK